MILATIIFWSASIKLLTHVGANCHCHDHNWPNILSWKAKKNNLTHQVKSQAQTPPPSTRLPQRGASGWAVSECLSAVWRTGHSGTHSSPSQQVTSDVCGFTCGYFSLYCNCFVSTVEQINVGETISACHSTALCDGHQLYLVMVAVTGTEMLFQGGIPKWHPGLACNARRILYVMVLIYFIISPPVYSGEEERTQRARTVDMC